MNRMQSSIPFSQNIPPIFRSQRRRLSSSSTTSKEASATVQMDLGRHFYLNKVLEQYAAKPATRMTLRQLVFFGRTLGRDREKILKSANYVRQELAVRIAHRIRDLQALPFVVMTNKHLEEVYEKYWSAFETFRKVSNIRSIEDNEEFCTTLKRLLDDHLTIIPSLTIGIVESSHHLSSDQLDGFMERMLRSRISRRVLAEQHIALSEALDDPFHFFNDSSSSSPESTANQGDGDHIGIIYTNLKVSSVISKVVGLLTKIFQDEVKAGIRTGDAAVIPTVVIDGALDTRFAYIPEHLEYIFFELLKNSMTAVMRQPLSARDPVTIRATIVEGPPDEDLIVRVSDCGGGLPDLLAKLSGSHARREHRRKHSSRLSASKKRRELIDDEGTNQGESFSRDSHNESRYQSLSEQSRSGEHFSMDSTLTNDRSGDSLDHQHQVRRSGSMADPIDIAMSHARHVHAREGAPGGSSVPSASTGRLAVSDALLAAVTSFSNVRRRLEIEDEEVRRARLTSQNVLQANPEAKAGSSSDMHNSKEEQSSFHQPVSTESPGGEKSAMGAGLRAAVQSQRETGIDSRAKMDALRAVGRFKGTVAEQLATHDAQKRFEELNLKDAVEDTNDKLPHSIQELARAALQEAIPRSPLTRQETGLGLPMCKIYTDFFGGSLNLRSLDGHGMDVYVRLPKLGTNKEAIEEIVL
ncbi:hypothetical protein L7F22_043927 [Adiantum nelumboides]|nr:hypothetical protein [Adiantum nelumboides]